MKLTARHEYADTIALFATTDDDDPLDLYTRGNHGLDLELTVEDARRLLSSLTRAVEDAALDARCLPTTRIDHARTAAAMPKLAAWQREQEAAEALGRG